MPVYTFYNHHHTTVWGCRHNQAIPKESPPITHQRYSVYLPQYEQPEPQLLTTFLTLSEVYQFARLYLAEHEGIEELTVHDGDTGEIMALNSNTLVNHP